jgi:pimeloyl-ACP methyl ester carboxylesterase
VKKSKSLRWFGMLAVALVVMLIAGSFGIARYYLTFSRHFPYDQLPTDIQMPYRTVHFPSRLDKVALEGWFIPGTEVSGERHLKRATVIVVHGHQSNMGRAGGINLLPNVVRPLHEQGFSVLMLDLRNHGKSGDLPPVTLGYWESDDVLGAIDYLDAQHKVLGIDPKRMGLFGVSMGGATSIYAAAADQQSERPHIRALFIESAFARTREPIELKLALDGVPSVLSSLLLFWLSMLPDRDILHNDPIEYIKNITSPIYFVHSQHDLEVSPKDSTAMHERALKDNPSRPAKLWISPGNGHATTPSEFPVEFAERMLGFFTTYL